MSRAPRSKIPLRDAASSLEPYASKPLKAAFLERGVRALTELADRLEPRELALAVAAETRASTLVRALCQPSAVGFVHSDTDPLAPARVRGIERRDALLAAEGGTLSTDEVAKLLRVTPQAVHKRRALGKLLGFELGRRGLRFPAWQFTNTGVLAGLDEVLAAFDDVPPLGVLRFFLSGNARLHKQRPLDALRKREITAVVAAARAFDTHGAA